MHNDSIYQRLKKPQLWIILPINNELIYYLLAQVIDNLRIQKLNTASWLEGDFV